MEKAIIAAEFGVINSIRYFAKKLLDREFKESTVRTWMNYYRNGLATKRKAGESRETHQQKRGHFLLFEEELDKQVRMYYLVALATKGCSSYQYSHCHGHCSRSSRES